MFTNALQKFRARWTPSSGAFVAENTHKAVLLRFAQMDADDVLDELRAHRSGLTTAEATARLSSLGYNIVTSKKPPSWWWLLLSVIPNPFNLLLGFIAIISVASPERSWVSGLLHSLG